MRPDTNLKQPKISMTLKLVISSLVFEFSGWLPSLWVGVGHCQNFRGFDIRGVPYVYINREIQGMPVQYVSVPWLEPKL